MLAHIEILDWLIIISIVWIGYKAGQISVFLQLKRAAKSMGLDLTVKDSDDDETHTPFKVEKFDNQYLAYSEGSFMAQAADFRSLLVKIKERFPDKKFVLESYERDELSEEESKKLLEAILNYDNDKASK